ncbi:MAG: Xaa-Pro peptidase family protein [Firmicutes bacterium]|nr:Xaa-Pro peptidase family protein [Bacillota bacterium]
MSEERLSRVRESLGARGLDGILLSGYENCLYVSGFTGEGHLVITGDAAFVLTDSRYYEQAGGEAPAFELVETPGSVHEVLPELVRGKGIRRLGFERDIITHGQFLEMSQALGTSGCDLVPTRGLVERMREVKSDAEAGEIRRACGIMVRAFQNLLPKIRPGVTEYDLAVEIEFEVRRLGADRIGFPAIVASGKRGSLPHARPTLKEIRAGEMVTVDFGAFVGPYCADMTRTVAVGDPEPKLVEIYEVVRNAQEAAVAGVRPGMSLREADSIARESIARAGYGQYFGHGLGHGIGLRIHESPRLSPRAPEDGVVREGMTVTVEPGIYVPGLGGVRIEDSVRVCSDGVEVFTEFTKELIRL